MCQGSNHRFTRSVRRAMFIGLLALLVCGCAGGTRDGEQTSGGRRSPAAPGAAGASPGSSPRDAAAEDTIALAAYYYDQGNYPAAIGLLTVARDWPQASVPVQIRARKLLAFSYCLDGRPANCQKYFEEILELDPRFDLTPYETGNPAWDPAFRRAKRTAEKRKGG